MVINDSPYMQRVPITIGTLHIRQALKLATEEGMKQLPEAWKIGNFPPMTKQTSVKESCGSGGSVRKGHNDQRHHH